MTKKIKQKVSLMAGLNKFKIVVKLMVLLILVGTVQIFAAGSAGDNGGNIYRRPHIL